MILIIFPSVGLTVIFVLLSPVYSISLITTGTDTSTWPFVLIVAVVPLDESVGLIIAFPILIFLSWGIVTSPAPSVLEVTVTQPSSRFLTTVLELPRLIVSSLSSLTAPLINLLVLSPFSIFVLSSAAVYSTSPIFTFLSEVGTVTTTFPVSRSIVKLALLSLSLV